MKTGGQFMSACLFMWKEEPYKSEGPFSTSVTVNSMGYITASGLMLEGVSTTLKL